MLNGDPSVTRIKAPAAKQSAEKIESCDLKRVHSVTRIKAPAAKRIGNRFESCDEKQVHSVTRIKKPALLLLFAGFSILSSAITALSSLLGDLGMTKVSGKGK